MYFSPAVTLPGLSCSGLSLASWQLSPLSKHNFKSLPGGGLAPVVPVCLTWELS